MEWSGFTAQTFQYSLFGLNIVIQHWEKVYMEPLPGHCANQWATSSGYKATVGDTTPICCVSAQATGLLERRRTAAIIYAITKLDYMRLLKDYLGLFSLGSRGQANLMYTSPCGPFPVDINMFKMTIFKFFNKKG